VGSYHQAAVFVTIFAFLHFFAAPPPDPLIFLLRMLRKKIGGTATRCFTPGFVMILAKLIQGLKQPTKHNSIQGLKILLALVFTTACHFIPGFVMIFALLRGKNPPDI